MQAVSLPVSKIELNVGQIEGLPKNPRQWTKADIEGMQRSLTETPELFEARPCIVIKHGDKYIILGGNLRFTGAKANGAKEVPCVVLPEGTPVDKLKEIVIKDNGAWGRWDYDMLANEWDDLPLSGWGVPAWDAEAVMQEDESAEIERKRKEFEERMKAGEISEEDEEYQEFLEKFKLAKTTDDCYTPELVYEAVANWVAKEYGVSRADFVRPFYPGGDYQKQSYKATDIVVDNPPFSILAEILKFYNGRGVKFFLFAPTLTLFSSSSSSSAALPCSVPIIYANGANVNTSFLTSLEPKGIRLRSAPSLYAAVKAANDENLRQHKKELPKYAYDHHVITAPFVGALSRLGIDFCVPVAESVSISGLDAQKESGKSIYGKGYLVSDRVYAEREKAEREKAEREKAERWELSERERAIVAKLNEQANGR